LDDLIALRPGDHVVHVVHGVGCYRGVENKQNGKSTLDLVVVEYAGGDKLFLPVYRLNQLEKHAGTDAAVKLDRLGGQTFLRTKTRVRKKVQQLADQLLKLYAERADVQRPPVPEPGDDYEAFSAAFPFEETRDQLDAILDTIGDLQRPVVMDRLVSGDVGFGKTEVALRAAFLNVMQSRQVAFLCPTTVLAQQHFLTCQARFKDHPIEVRVMSRFQSKKLQTETLSGLRSGTVDLVVGTHRLLSKDVHFKNLGLLVVVEEQRFGVSHKERIKQMKTTVDVLTLSATPIPRTLQMAVSGVRDLSMISTAPADRRSVRTIVSRVDDSLAKSAIERELSRGGQVFYVYNRVEGLEERAARLRANLPGLRVVVAHGQQSERTLERAMLGFVKGDFDVLCSTAIVESGLDIPRANTMVIDRADILGLSQLYQLRGRVGRSSVQAYCYHMVPAPSRMSDVARARNEAMDRHTELGSGIQIATMDMELSGAGDQWGAEQSGFLQSVGFELFSEMLRDATSELRGQSVVHPVDPVLSIDVEAHLPGEYVDDLGVRLSLYKRFSAALDRETVASLADEMVNRFGNPPPAGRRLVELMTLKVDLRTLRAEGCEASQERVTLHLRQDTPLEASDVMALVTSEPERYRVSPTGSITRTATTEGFKSGLEHAARAVSELLKLGGEKR
jgi:transcription-repair coupling factor (superfamily II helicase)